MTLWEDCKSVYELVPSQNFMSVKSFCLKQISSKKCFLKKLYLASHFKEEFVCVCVCVCVSVCVLSRMFRCLGENQLSRFFKNCIGFWSFKKLFLVFYYNLHEICFKTFLNGCLGIVIHTHMHIYVCVCTYIYLILKMFSGSLPAGS